MHHLRGAALDRLGHGHLLDLRRPLLPRDLGAEREQVVFRRHDGGAVDRRQPRNHVDDAGDRVLPRPRALARLTSRGSTCRARRRAATPRRGSAGRSIPATPLSQPGRRAACRRGRARASTRRAARARSPNRSTRPANRSPAATSAGRTVGQARCVLVDDFDLIAFEHRDVHELSGFSAAVMLDDEQARRGDLDDDAQRRNRPDGSPHP